MSISERTLRKWRKEALQQTEDKNYDMSSADQLQNKSELLNRIIKMTQELLDQHLLRK